MPAIFLRRSRRIPLGNEALRFYKSGPPFLHNYFPFWMAALMGKLIVLISILAVLYPIRKSLPHLYKWMMSIEDFAHVRRTETSGG